MPTTGPTGSMNLAQYTYTGVTVATSPLNTLLNITDTSGNSTDVLYSTLPSPQGGYIQGRVWTANTGPVTFGLGAATRR